MVKISISDESAYEVGNVYNFFFGESSVLGRIVAIYSGELLIKNKSGEIILNRRLIEVAYPADKAHRDWDLYMDRES